MPDHTYVRHPSHWDEFHPGHIQSHKPVRKPGKIKPEAGHLEKPWFEFEDSYFHAMFLRGMLGLPDTYLLSFVRESLRGMNHQDIVDTIQKDPDIPQWFKKAKGVNAMTFKTARQLFYHANPETQVELVRFALTDKISKITSREEQRRGHKSPNVDYILEVQVTIMTAFVTCLQNRMDSTVSVLEEVRRTKDLRAICQNLRS